MTPIGFNLNFLHNKEQYIKSENAPYAKTLIGLMLLTGVQRLFEKEDVFELMKRAQILLPEQRIIDNFFTNDSLFTFKFNELSYQFTVVHLKDLIGLETLNEPENYTPHIKWESNVSHNKLMYDMLVAGDALNGLELTVFQPLVNTVDGDIEVNFNKNQTPHTIKYSSGLLKQAELLANTIVNEIPENNFQSKNKKNYGYIFGQI